MVLVIDDDPSVAPLVRGLLRAGGEASLDVRGARTLGGGLELVREEEPCLVLLDLRLPDCDGLETIRSVRAAVQPDTPVVAITVAGDRDLAVAAMRQGADDFLLKTELTASTISRTVRHALERAGFRASRRSAEAAIRSTVHRLEVAVEAGRLGVWELDPTTRAFGCSAEHARLMGLAPNESTVALEEMAARVHPDDRGVFGRMLLPPGVSDGVERDEFRVLLASGQVRFVEVHWRRLRDAEGRPHQVAGVSSDVTERWLASEKEIQSQRMNAIGEVAAGIAHDLGNTLMLASSALGSLDDEILGAPAALARDNMALAIDQARELVHSLLALARPTDTNESADLPVDVGGLAESFVRFLRCVLPRGIRITVDRGADPSFVRMKPTHGRQVLMNLVLNARDALLATGEGTGDIEVRVRSAERGGAMHVIEVVDDGPGIDPERADTLFEPFVQLRRDGGGVGLGLAIVRSLVLAAGGTVELLNRNEGGAVARVYLPRVECVPDDEPPSTEACAADGEGVDQSPFAVALVERQDYVRRVICDGLTDGGLSVTEYPTAAELVRAIADGHRPAVIVVNGDDAGSDARSLADDLARCGCDARVVLMTAQSETLSPSNMVIRKPFSIVDLLRAVRGLLAQGAAS